MDFTDAKGNSDLHFAKSGAEVEEMLEAGYSIDAPNKSGLTPLHQACRFGRVGAVAALLAHCAALDATTNGGETPLHLAARNGKNRVAELLIAKGCPVSPVDKHGRTPLYLACRHNHRAVVATLMKTGRCACPPKTETPLHVAAANGAVGAVEELLQQSAWLRSVDTGGWTALHSACKNGDPRVVAAILAACDLPLINAGDAGGWTALHLAAHYNRLDAAKLLVDAGADVVATDSDGWTPRDRARKFRHSELAKYLTEVSPSHNWTGE